MSNAQASTAGEGQDRVISAWRTGLTRLLAERSEAEFGNKWQVVSCEPLTGGYSRIMLRAGVRAADGREEVLVVRGDPEAGAEVFVTDRHAEWLLLQSLGSGLVPTPRARYFDAGIHLPTPSIVIEFCDGPNLHHVLGQGDADLERWTDEVISALACIHRTDPARYAGVLPDPPDWDAYLGGLIDQWSSAERQHVESVPLLRYLASWLRLHQPPPLPFALVHGDFQAANLVATPGRLQIVDWEYAHLGDPREDIGWYNLVSASGGIANLYARDPEGFLARYREQTGTTPETVNQATVAYFSVLATTRIFLDILRSAAAMSDGLAHGATLTYMLNSLPIGHANFLSTCQALEGAL